MTRRVPKVAVVAGVLLGLVACSEGPSSARALEQRAKQYWDARETRDLLTQYKLEAAAQPGGWLTPDKIEAVTGMPVRGVQVKEVKIDGDKAVVTVSAKVLVGQMGWVAQDTKDRWVLLNDGWYHQTFKYKGLGELVRKRMQEAAEEQAKGSTEMPPEQTTAVPSDQAQAIEVPEQHAQQGQPSQEGQGEKSGMD